jgi:hypothetical protein
MIVALTHIWSGVSSHAPDARIDLSAHRQGSTNPILVAPFLQYRRLHAHPLRVRCRRLPARSRKHLHYNSFLVILSAADSYRLGVRTESCRDRNRPALRPSWPSDAQRGGPRHHQQYMMHAGLPFRRTGLWATISSRANCGHAAGLQSPRGVGEKRRRI